MNGRNLVALPVRHQDCCRYILRFVPAPNLSVLNARPRQDKQLLLWYCLRAIDTTGCGVLDQEQDEAKPIRDKAEARAKLADRLRQSRHFASENTRLQAKSKAKKQNKGKTINRRLRTVK